ncbi:MAG: hypothetical protein COA79_00015 [Planctomycetota bacterium]|nr:MAG: hypothetical protein COA79_00015 [Planctomycetota bacterium]
MKFIVLFCSLILVSFSILIIAEDDPYKEFTIKRKSVYEFTTDPKVKVDGDKITISFTSKDYCDATVAIENKSGKIIRHLASGVLGKNAPEPFKKNSLSQTLIWDSKNDQGRYVKDKKNIRIRVSLGLYVEYDKALNYSPHKRIGQRALIKMAPEGLYVFESRGRDNLRLFDRNGKYIKTIYPFPADQINNVIGLKWTSYPKRKKVPLKNSNYHQTFLTSGDNDDEQSGLKSGMVNIGASGIAIHGKKIAIAHEHLNRLATDGSTGGLPLSGPKTGISFKRSGYGGEGSGTVFIGPSSMAFSPDGKTLYYTGIMWHDSYTASPGVIPVVYQMSYAKNDEPTVFAGFPDLKKYGNDDKHFGTPTSLDLDANGNVYVTDYINDRIQVFSPVGKLIKSIICIKPAKILIHKKTNKVYVFSWSSIGMSKMMLNDKRYKKYNGRKVKQTLTTISAFPICKVESVEEFKIGNYPAGRFTKGAMTHISIDSWAKELTFWVSGKNHIRTEEANKWSGRRNSDAKAKRFVSGVRKYQKVKGIWTEILNFGNFVNKTVKRGKSLKWNIQNLYVNPSTGKLYVGEADSGPTGKAFMELLEIDPNTGEVKVIVLPFNPMDIAFDLDGLIYMRTMNILVRYDTKTWKEVPFDYGAEKKRVGQDGGIGGTSSPSISCILLPATNAVCYHQGGMSINAKGDIAIACHTATKKYKSEGVAVKDVEIVKTYQPSQYPGRTSSSTSLCIHVWDKRGQIKMQDVVNGTPMTDGVFIDNKLNLYMMATKARTIKGKYLQDGMSSTLIKFKPKKGRFLQPGKNIPIPLSTDNYPKRKQEIKGFWVEDYEWIYGGVGYGGFNASWSSGGCACWFARFKLDYFQRSFVPEPMQYSVSVLDSNGNLILRIGQYGNEDSSGKKGLVKTKGDGIGLFHPAFTAVHSDKRVFISDVGNARIVSAFLKYHKEKIIDVK